jgi:tryptophan synthase alpha chain
VLQDEIVARRAKKELLVMAHLVLGYPSYDENEKTIAAMAANGADIIEVQLPFSEPSDGPVILRANAAALAGGATTSRCLDFLRRVTALYPATLFIGMTYLNVAFARGMDRFVEDAAACRLSGLILPDLPPEEGATFEAATARCGVAPIYLMTPTTPTDRLTFIAQHTRGMVYGVGRKGVTGVKTSMGREVDDQIQRYRRATTLPLGLGFGIQSKEDVDHLRGKVDIAILGTKLLTLSDQGGAAAVGAFLASFNDR